MQYILMDYVNEYGKLVAFLAARTRDVAAAEDALSEAFVLTSRIRRYGIGG